MSLTTENIVLIVAGLIIISVVNTFLKETVGKLAMPLTIFAILCIATGVVSADNVVEYVRIALEFLVGILTDLVNLIKSMLT